MYEAGRRSPALRGWLPARRSIPAASSAVIYSGPRLLDFVNGERSAARVSSFSQALVGIQRNLVLRIPAIPGPGQSDVSGTGETGELVDVAAGFVEIHTPAQPNPRSRRRDNGAGIPRLRHASTGGLRLGLSKTLIRVKHVP